MGAEKGGAVVEVSGLEGGQDLKVSVLLGIAALPAEHAEMAPTNSINSPSHTAPCPQSVS